MGQNLHRQTAGAVKSGKVIGRAFQGAGGPVGNGSQCVAQQFAFLIHTGNYSAFRQPKELGTKRHSLSKLKILSPRAGKTQCPFIP